jgi:hypothetical protein
MLTLIQKIELFYNDVLDALLIKFNLEEEEFVNLICFNRFILKIPYDAGLFYVNEFLEEFLEFLGLKINKNIIYIKNKIKVKDLKDYGINYIWYGRKGNSLLYDKAQIKGID